MDGESASTGVDTNKNPTLSDVAKAAGVSYATADRVVNQRGNVAKKSELKVHEAVSALGYVRNQAAANLSRGRRCRLAFLVPGGSNAFFNQVRTHLHELKAHLLSEQVFIDIIEVDAFRVESLRLSLSSIVDTRYDGVAVVGLQSSKLASPIKKLVQQGTAVVGLVSDLPKELRSDYIGIDNVAAGRTAARLIGISHGGQPGRVQMLIGSMDAQDHSDRVSGCTQVLSEDFPNLEVLDPITTGDDAEIVQASLEQLLTSKKTVSAVYNVGAGNSGLIAAVAQCPRQKCFFCVAHELTAHSQQALLNNHIDLVIDQRPDLEVNRALTVLRAMFEARDLPPLPDLVPTIYVRDNLPSNMSNNAV